MTYDPNDPILIAAAEESGLAKEYADDPALLRFYMVKLLKFGWAGVKTPTEARYMTLARRAIGKGQSAEQIAARVAASKAARIRRTENHSQNAQGEPQSVVQEALA